MRVLLIDDDPASMQTLLDLFTQKRIKAVTNLRTLQEAIETIETQSDTISFAVCNYRGGSSALLKLFLQVGSGVPSLIFAEKGARVEKLALLPREARLDFLERGDLPGFLRIVDQLCDDGVLETRLAPDGDFFRLPVASLNLEDLPPVDLYIRLAPHRYCLRFRRDAGPDPEGIRRYGERPGYGYLYGRKEALEAWLSRQDDHLSSLLDGTMEASPDDRRRAAEESLELVHNVVSQLGFTPKIEDIAKKTAALTLKALGNSPQLSDILRRMQLQDGKYIASHSLMLAEITCAIAHRLDWTSAPTFLKLTVAAFLHDLHLPSNRLARMKSLTDVTEENGFSSNDFQTYKMHPIQAAAYAQQLRQLPADVDVIVLQHHELPDGTGFPRGLYHHQISPLACVFIVGQDLLDYFLANAAADDPKDDVFPAFLEERDAKYGVGTFKKIFDVMKGDPF